MILPMASTYFNPALAREFPQYFGLESPLHTAAADDDEERRADEVLLAPNDISLRRP